ncbi:MFS transporter [Nocardioides sp.]|uniref:MFS transporter n=1 Tax=Nocardioides sp. TaxID=35761 RepID=UPI0039E4DBAE
MVNHLGRARRAAQASFFAQGMVYITLTTRLEQFRDEWDLSSAVVPLLLLMLVLLAGVGSVVAERLAERHDSATMLRAGLVGIAVALVLVVAAPVLAVYVAGLALYGVALGVVDATTNMQAVAVEHRYGRPILPSFHGAWTLGGVLGALVTVATGDDVPLWTIGVVAVVPLLASLAPLLPRVSAPPEAEAAATDIAWRPILLVGLGMVLFYMVDTAAATWGPTHGEKTFGVSTDTAAIASLLYLLATLAARFAGDGLVARYGAVPVLRVGTVIGVAALAVVVFAPSWPVAVVGFALLGAGIAVIAPLSFSAAARIAGADQARTDAVIARFNQFNYVGALLGAVMTGAVGAVAESVVEEGSALRIGFAVPMVLLLAMLPLARAFAPSSRVRSG